MNNYKCVWKEHFDQGEFLNIDNWEYSEGGNGWGNGELQYYTKNCVKNAEICNKKLIIRSLYENYKGNSFTSAKLISKKAWKYGKIEVRAKIPVARGTWPAIWLLSSDYNGHNWPFCGEIDILEHFGHTFGEVQFSLHSYEYNFYKHNKFNKKIYLGDKLLDFNIYTIEWTESYISFSVNGIIYYTAYKNDCINITKKEWPFDNPFHLILNLAVGGHHAGKYGIDIDKWPQEFIIDYINIYQLQ